MFKKILFKLIKKNADYYNFIVEKVIEERRLELIEKLIGNAKVYVRDEIVKLDGDIKDSILINCYIRDSMINKIERNIFEKSVISNNYTGNFKTKKQIDIEKGIKDFTEFV